MERADSQKGEQQGGLNKGGEDKAVVLENSGEWRGGLKLSALSPRSLLTTLETMGAIWYTLMVSQALCQALDCSIAHPWKQVMVLTYFIDEERKAQRDKLTCLSSPEGKGQNWIPLKFAWHLPTVLLREVRI